MVRAFRFLPFRPAELAAWTFVLGCALGLRLFDLGQRAMSHDESLHALFSFNLLNGLAYAHHPMTHGPFLFHANALIYSLFGVTDFTARLLPALAGTVLCAAPLLLRFGLGRTGAWCAGLLLAFSPTMLFYSRYIRNDIYMSLFCVTWAAGLLDFLVRGRSRALIWAVGGLALSFSTKETAFIFGAVFGTFTLAAPLLQGGGGLRAYLRHRGASLSLLMLVLVMPFLSALPMLALGYDPAIFEGAGLRPTLHAVGIMAVLSLSISYVWLESGLSAIRSRDWWLALGGAWLLWTLLYTTLFTNPAGLASGFGGSLGYWLGQQGVARGGQPWFYYPMLTLIYEPAPALAALSGFLGLATGRFGDPADSVGGEAKEWSRLLRFLLPWWTGLALFMFTVAGEKMPWLLTGPLLPMCLLGGGWLGLVAGHLRVTRVPPGGLLRSVGTGLAVMAVVLLFLADVRTGLRLTFVNGELPVEVMVYAHATPDIKPAIRIIESRREAESTARVTCDEESSWPLAWYLRDLPVVYAVPPAGSAPDALSEIVILCPENSDRLRAVLLSTHSEKIFRLIWWPDEGYKDAPVCGLVRLLADPSGRAVLWDFWWNRNLPEIDISSWPLRREFHLWHRRGPSPNPF